MSSQTCDFKIWPFQASLHYPSLNFWKIPSMVRKWKKKHKERHTSRDWLWTLWDWGESNLQRVDLRSLLGICSDGWRWSMSPRSLGWGDSTQISCFLCFFLYLIGALEHGWIMTFHILGMSSSQLTNSYFSGGLKPPTSYIVLKQTTILYRGGVWLSAVKQAGLCEIAHHSLLIQNQFVLNSFGFLHLCIFYIRLSLQYLETV